MANQLDRAMDRKARNIRNAQDKKERSIAFFNSVNSAIAFIPHVLDATVEWTDDDYKKTVIFWRNWFFSEWEKSVVREEEQPEQETVEDVEGDELPVIAIDK